MNLIFRAGVLAETKPEHGRPNDKRIVMKFALYQFPNHGIMCELFPKAKSIFITRLPRASIVSSTKCGQSLHYGFQWLRANYFRILSLPLPYTKKGQTLWQRYFANYNKFRFLQLSALAYAACYLSYLEFKQTFKRYTLYEELTTKPEEVMTKILEFLDVPTCYAKECLKALNWHSQHHIFGDTTGTDMNFGKKEDWIEVDRIFKEMGLPLSVDMKLEELKKILE